MIQGVASQPVNHSNLVNQLNLLEDLWQKLVYVKWSQESLNLLARLAKEMTQAAHGEGNDRLSDAIWQLEQRINVCVSAGTVPPEAERQKFKELFRQLRHLLTSTEKWESGTTPVFTDPVFTTEAEVFLFIGADSRQVLTKLEDAGYKVRFIDSLTELEQLLPLARPVALVVDVDASKGDLGGIAVITELRERLKFTTPVLFLAERDDMAARLEAIRAGGLGYFNKPIDVGELLEALQNLLAQQSDQIHERILIVCNSPDDAKAITPIFESKAINSRLVTQPLQLLQEIHRFQPDLVLIDLDLKVVDGVELAVVLGQHPLGSALPLILLSSQAELGPYLSPLQQTQAWVDLLVKPVEPNYLLWQVRQRLRRGRALGAKLSNLVDKDSVSGLYNRHHFVNRLERYIARMGVSTRSVAVLFILLDNLRAIRDSTSVAVADELIGQVAGRLRRALGPRQQGARFTEAIFAVLVSDASRDALVRMARTLRDALEGDVYEVGDYSIRLRTCTGISIANDDDDALTLIRNADEACSLAREVKNERIYVHHGAGPGTVTGDDMQRQQVLAQVQEAVEQKRLKLVFQPIVSLRVDQAERYEVLLRMFNKAGREIPIKTVFSIVQWNDLGQTLDRWVASKAINMLSERQAKGVLTTLFIKLSQATLQDRFFPEWLDERLREAKLAADHLVFQIAETTSERYLRETIRFQQRIKELGCGLSIEGFGRGMDSLGLLKSLTADCVKLDNFFAHDLVSDEEKQEQLKRLVFNLDSFGVASIVSGVEDMHTLPLLWSLGINYVQGFFLQQPFEEMNYDFQGSSI